MRRVLSLAYVRANGEPARVTVTLLELGSAEAALALYTERVVPDSPDEAVWKTFDAGGAAALAGATALVWRAERVAELVYRDDLLLPGRLSERAERELPAVARHLGSRLPGKADLPASVTLLPRAHGGPLSVRFEHEDLLGVSGIGPGARAEYSGPNGRSSVVVMARPDEDAAKDVERTLRRVPGARQHKGAPYGATSLTLREGEAGPRVAWVFGRKKSVVLGIGDAIASRADGAVRPQREAKLARLKQLIDGL